MKATFNMKIINITPRKVRCGALQVYGLDALEKTQIKTRISQKAFLRRLRERLLIVGGVIVCIIEFGTVEPCC
ncbi:MAG TPA: hypothetical protein VEC97_02670 [Candidatus Acidoferrales bacterium]|nr:hypothetical protein [Candidatus Acidoferrales bacterium]